MKKTTKQKDTLLAAIARTVGHVAGSIAKTTHDLTTKAQLLSESPSAKPAATGAGATGPPPPAARSKAPRKKSSGAKKSARRGAGKKSAEASASSSSLSSPSLRLRSKPMVSNSRKKSSSARIPPSH